MKSIKIAASRFALCVALVVCAVMFAAPAGVAARDLLVQTAGENGLWVAQVQPDVANNNALVTVIRFRGRSSDAWSETARLSGRAVGLAARGSQLAVLMDGGEWSLLWASGSVLGQPVPQGGVIRAMAGDGETLWALARMPAVLPATQPAEQAAVAPSTEPSARPPQQASTQVALTATTAVAQAPATRAARAGHWELFRLDSAGWRSTGELAISLDADVSLAADRGRTLTAAKMSGGFRDGGVINVFANAAPLAELPFTHESLFAILPTDSAPLFWMAGDLGAGQIRKLTAGATDTVLAAPKDLPPNADRAVAISTGRLRLIYTKSDHGKMSLLEQKYDLTTLQPIDAPAVLNFPVPQADSTFQTVFSAVVMAALVFSMIASFQHRRSVLELMLKEDRPQPAALGPRMLAAAIDLLPMFIGFLVICVLVPKDIDPATAVQDPKLERIGAIAMAVYLLHTTLIEVIVGRSIGKMIVGLRIVGLDGKPATFGALLARNLLRIIELAFLPMVGLVFFSPLRQRAGDIAAGTLVVSNKAQPDPADPGSA